LFWLFLFFFFFFRRFFDRLSSSGLVAEYLSQLPLSTFKWAIAGRSREKLEKVKQMIEKNGQHHVDIIIASSTDPASLDFVKDTSVVISTVGPFMKYGRPLVDACVKHSTHYIDSTGESPFVKAYSEAHHETAKQAQIKLVSFCGFDSIPSDLGVFFLVER
jgi:short subunit dehydrogenase-like uncharacterized protein